MPCLVLRAGHAVKLLAHELKVLHLARGKVQSADGL
jgi:hypothetical protein